MNSLQLKIVGMHCASCEKLLKKALLQIDHIKQVDLSYKNEIATLHYNPEINVNYVISLIRKVGYDAMVIDQDYVTEDVTFTKYLDHLKHKNTVEGKLVWIALGTFVVLSVLEIIAYFGFFRTIPGFFDRFGYYITFLVLSVVVSGTSVWHIRAYGSTFSCMSGMMIGMTSGMISGFLIGLIVGATNGMFIGSLVGLGVGIFIGIVTGKCCGVMGVMEGMMAGFMGGLMGAMTSLMMLNDHLKIIIPVLVGVSTAILLGLDYMIYKEVGHLKEKVNKSEFLPFITFCFVVTIGITFLMVYGPKSILFQ